MGYDFPELTSFGTLLRFATALEQATAHLARSTAQVDECAEWRDGLLVIARKHQKRSIQLERMRREWLNEVVLQAIDGMDAGDYVPPLELPPGVTGLEAMATVRFALERGIDFYTDAASRAANVLVGVERAFKRFVRENKRLFIDLG